MEVMNGVRPQTVSFEFLERVHRLIVDNVLNPTVDSKGKVVEFKHPKELKGIIDLSINNEGTDDEALVNICSQVIHYGVKTGHRAFFNQLYAGVDAYSLSGSYLTEAMNTSAYTFEVAPVFTLVEMAVLEKMRNMLGWTDGDGLFCPGGSFANTMAVNLARYHFFPEVKTKGMRALPDLCFFTSQQSHYSLKKAASFLGLGLDSVIIVDCDYEGRMLSHALEKAVVQSKKDGLTPFFVNATAATTVFGAYDPIRAIAKVCKLHDLWLHVDGCLGCSAVLSPKHRHLLDGIELVDSASWNPHKLMGPPLQCSALLVRRKHILNDCYSANARYLFQKDKFYDVSYDTGDKTVQCGRKVDAFKFWLMWKAKGDSGFASDMETIFDNARYLYDKIKSNDSFIVVREPQSINVCFWFVPPCLKNKPRTDEWWKSMAKVAPAIKEMMVKEGTLLVGYSPLGDLVNFFRLSVSNPNTTSTDMDLAVAQIERLGNQLDENWLGKQCL